MNMVEQIQNIINENRMSFTSMFFSKTIKAPSYELCLSNDSDMFVMRFVDTRLPMTTVCNFLMLDNLENMRFGSDLTFTEHSNVFENRSVITSIKLKTYKRTIPRRFVADSYIDSYIGFGNRISVPNVFTEIKESQESCIDVFSFDKDIDMALPGFLKGITNRITLNDIFISSKQ